MLGQKIASFLGEKAEDPFAGDPLAHILPWLAYDQENGVFINKTTSGFIIEAIPIVGCSDATQKEISSIFQDLLEEGDSLQCLLWADHRVDAFLNPWVKRRETQSEIYRSIARRRALHFKQGSHRLFRFILSFSSATPSKLKEKKEKILKLLKSFTYAFSWDVHAFMDTMSALINFSEEPTVVKRAWNPYQTLSSQLPMGGVLQVHEDYLFGNTCFKNYRVIDYPDEWSLPAMQLLIGDVYRDAYRLKCPFFLHYGVHCPKQSKEETKFWKKSHLIEKQGRSLTLLRFIPELEAELKECDSVRRGIHQQEKFVYTQLSAGIWSSKERLAQAEQSLKSLFRINQFSLVENRFLQLPTFLSCLPMTWGEYAKDLKDLNLLRTTLTSECAHFVPIQGEWTGSPTPGMLLSGRRGQCVNWNPFDNKAGNYNVVVVGRSGSGKSVFMQDLIVSGLSHGAKVFILEVGRSFEKTCALLEGQSIAFAKDAHICLNPFTFISLEDEEERNTSFSFIKSVIACMAAPTRGTDDFENGMIEKGIHDAWEKKKNLATITDVAKWLQQAEDPRAKTVGVMLTPYTNEGVYAKYFEGRCNVDFVRPMVLVELEELKEKKDLQAVVLQLFIIAITNLTFLGDRKTPFFICIDEAWDLLRGKQTGVFIETLARRLRKYHGSLVIGTQSVDDFFASSGAQAAFENSDWMCLLAQKQSSITRLIESGKFTMSEAQKVALESVTTVHGEFSEVMICDANGNYSIERLILDPFSQLLYSTQAQEYAEIKELQKQGLTVAEAINKMLERKSI